MRIEENWDDAFVYCIDFELTNHEKMNKILVFSGEPNEEELLSVLSEKFPTISKINHIDQWDEAIVLKEIKCLPTL